MKFLNSFHSLQVEDRNTTVVLFRPGGPIWNSPPVPLHGLPWLRCLPDLCFSSLGPEGPLSQFSCKRSTLVLLLQRIRLSLMIITLFLVYVTFQTHKTELRL